MRNQHEDIGTPRMEVVGSAGQKQHVFSLGTFSRGLCAKRNKTGLPNLPGLAKINLIRPKESLAHFGLNPKPDQASTAL